MDTRTQREAERQRLIDDIRVMTFEKEEGLGRINLQRMFLRLLDKNLADDSTKGISNIELAEIPFNIKEEASRLFLEVWEKIERFQESEREGKMLLAKLLELVANDIAAPHYRALRRLEINRKDIV